MGFSASYIFFRIMKIKEYILDLTGTRVGTSLYFIDDSLGYKVIGASGNYLIASRDLDQVEDEYEIRSRTFWAWPQKIILINTKHNLKGATDKTWDLRIKKNITKLLNGLKAGTIEINNPRDLQIIPEALD
jgi:hypothetical protein